MEDDVLLREQDTIARNYRVRIEANSSGFFRLWIYGNRELQMN